MTPYRPRLQRRLMRVLAGYAVLVGAMFGGLAMLFVYAVEDQFFVTTLRAEAERQRLHRSTHGAWTAPALPFVSLYAQGQGLPADLARQRAAQPFDNESKRVGRRVRGATGKEKGRLKTLSSGPPDGRDAAESERSKPWNGL